MAKSMIAVVVLVFGFIGSVSAQHFGHQKQSVGQRILDSALDGVTYGARRTFDFTIDEMRQDSQMQRQMIQQGYNHVLMKDMMYTQAAMMERQMAVQYSWQERSEDRAEVREYRQRHNMPPPGVRVAGATVPNACGPGKDGVYAAHGQGKLKTICPR